MERQIYNSHNVPITVRDWADGVTTHVEIVGEGRTVCGESPEGGRKMIETNAAETTCETCSYTIALIETGAEVRFKDAT